jgi:uncharacterized protein YkwD
VVALAAIAAGVLAIFGIGAAVIPSLASGGNSSGGSSSSAANGVSTETSAGTGGEPSTEPSAEPSATAAPTGKPSATPTVAGNPRLEEQVLALVNDERRKARCEPVRMDDRLRAAARAHSVDMAVHNFVNHTGSDGSSPQDRMRRAGYGQGTSENIARGQRDAEDVMRAWMHDRSDRDNIVDCNAKALGVGVAYRGRTPYWTQDFGR